MLVHAMNKSQRTTNLPFALLVITSLLGFPLFGLQPGQVVENFRLLDESGNSHELHYYKDATAIVVMVQGNGCQIVRNAMPTFRDLRNKYTKSGVEFFLLNSNIQDRRASVKKESEDYGYDIPVLLDSTQLVGEALGLTRTGEVFVINPDGWTIAYHGAIDDRLTYEKQKSEAQQHYLNNALEALIVGQDIAQPSTSAVGCLVNFPYQNAQVRQKPISYSNDIAPILIKNCVSCHRTGGIGPWAMTDFDMVFGFSPMIREVIRTDRMPPWHADPMHGDFRNDRSLSDEEKRTLVHWIESGSPKESNDDPLIDMQYDFAEWKVADELGEPDQIIQIPASEIPATGVVDYKYHYVKNPIEKDVWVHAVEIVPGDHTVLHHVITAFGKRVSKGDRQGRFRPIGGLRGYAPGITYGPFPEGTGVFLPADATLQFQVHYTTSGRPTIDESQMALWFHEKPPEKSVFSRFIVNRNIKIPAHSMSHAETAEYVFPKPAILYNLLPHAHFRGKAAQFEAYYPDGSSEMLLSVPNYDFNWQTTYEFSEPKVIPAGTKIVQTNWWDNSTRNHANPNPNIDVTWGEQSWEEMLFGAFLMRFLSDEEYARTHIQKSANSSLSAAGGD